MTDTLRNMPRYIRNTNAFGWQGADGPNGPWRSIAPPQSGTPWQQDITPIDALRAGNAVMTQPLSSVAQAVLATYGAEIGGIDAIMGSERRGLAAALRVVATEVVLDKYQYADRDAQLRRNILAIAAELESAQ